MSVTILPTLPEKLAASELFANVPISGLAEILEVARIRRMDEGTTIFVQGAPCERCHVVLDGRVRILQTDQDGAQIVMRYIGPGEMFGAIGIFTDHVYPAHAVTVIDCTEISWPEVNLLELIEHYPQIGINLVKIIGRRLQEAQDRLRELATQRVERRIANALLRLAAQAGWQRDDGMAIDMPLSRKDIAELCGTTLHTVSRTLTSWEKAGVLTTNNQRLTMHDLAEIRRLADNKVM